MVSLLRGRRQYLLQRPPIDKGDYTSVISCLLDLGGVCIKFSNQFFNTVLQALPVTILGNWVPR